MVYVFLADGFEETEAIGPIDALRRAGIEVRTVGITGKQVTSSHNITMLTDCTPEEFDLEKAEMIFLPGGLQGVNHLIASTFVAETILSCDKKNIYIAAICAAPSVVLGRLGVLKGRKATCYPTMESGMTGALAQDQAVVTDGTYITGRAAGCTLEFAMTLIEALRGKAAAQKVAADICYEG